MPRTRTIPARGLRACLAGAMRVASVAVAGAAQTAAGAQPLVLPFPATIESVIEQGRIEGHPVSVVRFRSAQPVGAILAGLAHDWRGAGRAPVLEAGSGAWRIVSSFDSGAYRTVQVRAHPAGGSEGLFSVWTPSPGTGRSRLDPEAVLPPAATVLRRLSAVDAGRITETVVARTDAAVRWTLAALDSRLESLGFVADPIPLAGASGGMRLYRRRGQEIALTVSAHDGRSAVVLHLTEESP